MFHAVKISICAVLSAHFLILDFYFKMKQILSFILLFVFHTQIDAQCTSCSINTTCSVSPLAPALCPEVLPNASQGIAYDTDVTFFIPQQFDNGGINVTLSQITITTISGLPSGLTWTANEADNIYDITADPLTQRGCVKICGIPEAIGSYTIAVNVIATVSAPISTTAPQTFTLPLLVLPGAGGNSGFTFDPVSGCDSLEVNFEALITSSTQPVSYLWDFGNGNSSTDLIPETQLYALPDTYVVNLQTNFLDYVLENVTFNATGSNWCGDIEEPSIPFIGTCTGSPDVYFQLTIGSSTQQSSTVDNTTAFSLSDLQYVINEPVFGLTFFDEDVVTANDDLGSTILQITAPGTYNFNTSQGYGSYTIGTQIGLSFTNSDTLIVFDSPDSPIISYSDTTICAGDSVLLSVDSSNFHQWYFNGEQLFGANGPSIYTSDPGLYQVEIRADGGCGTFSQEIEVQVFQNPDSPTLFFNPITNNLLFNAGPGFNWIWYLDGVAIQNSNNLTSIQPQVEGNYGVIVENLEGCSATSPNYPYVFVGIDEASSQLNFSVFPQPWNNGPLFLEGVLDPAQFSLLDVSGRIVFTTYLEGNQLQQIQIPTLSAGLYFMNITSQDKAATRLFIVK
jgi:PKD repeat protein